jgi:restriction system protein
MKPRYLAGNACARLRRGDPGKEAQHPSGDDMSNTPRLFLTRAGRDGEDEEFALEQSLAVIGFRDIPSLQAARDYPDVQRLVEAAHPDAAKRRIGNWAGQLWAFAISMAEGDIVVMPCKTSGQIAIGRVSGPYKFQMVGDALRHTRPVRWQRKDVTRTNFRQDLLDSMGAFMTVCQIQRNGAVDRVMAVMNGDSDPGLDSQTGEPAAAPSETQTPATIAEEHVDYERSARDKIIKFIAENFREHDLTHLVAAVLAADGWVTKVSKPGPDGGVDIYAGRGSLGTEQPRLVVEVKSQRTPADVGVYRGLKSSIQTFNADHGLLVCLGGFNRAVDREARQDHFKVRLWTSEDLLDAIVRLYPAMSKEMQSRLPLKPIWTLLDDEATLG